MSRNYINISDIRSPSDSAHLTGRYADTFPGAFRKVSWMNKTKLMEKYRAKDLLPKCAVQTQLPDLQNLFGECGEMDFNFPKLCTCESKSSCALFLCFLIRNT